MSRDLKRWSEEAIERWMKGDVPPRSQPWQIVTRDQANFDADRHPRGQRDWHVARNNREPRCGADQWRTRDRMVVMYMHEMEDRHLGHCIRFASTMPQHASRLSGLLAERARRRSY